MSDESTPLVSAPASPPPTLPDANELHPVTDGYDTFEKASIYHDDSVCPHTQPKRHCKGRLSRPAFCALVITTTLIVSGLAVFGIIYGVGEV